MIETPPSLHRARDAAQAHGLDVSFRERPAANSLAEAAALGGDGHKHPHDAIFLPSGDMVVATWNPGRLSYWKKL